MNRLLKRSINISKGASPGFTLLEAIVVIAVMAVILTVALPTTINWLRGRGVRDAAYQLSMDLQRAKVLAIERSVNCSITINTPGPNQYTISLINEIVDLDRNQGSVVFSDTPDASAPVITFTPQGVCQVSGPIYLVDQNPDLTGGQNLRYRVRTTVSGSVSVHLDTFGQWT